MFSVEDASASLDRFILYLCYSAYVLVEWRGPRRCVVRYQRVTTDLSWSHGRGPFNSARISRTVSRKVWFSTLSTEVCRHGINKCRARSKSGERSSQRVASPRPNSSRRAVQNSDQVRAVSFRSSSRPIAKRVQDDRNSVRPEGRVRGSVAGL